jgi:hypothetical protein
MSPQRLNDGEIVKFAAHFVGKSGFRRPCHRARTGRSWPHVQGWSARMIEPEDKEPSGGRATLVALAAHRQPAPSAAPISFDRRELNAILNVYGRHVAEGEWRDYAIDHRRDEAVFSIFRRASEMPLYRIVKQPKLARRQGAYSLITATGMVLKRGHDLQNVLRVLDKPLRLVRA